MSKDKSSKLFHQLARIASLLGQCDKEFVNKSLRIDLGKVIEKTLKLSIQANQEKLTQVEFESKIRDTFDELTNELHSVLIRIGIKAKSELVYDAFMNY